MSGLRPSRNILRQVLQAACILGWMLVVALVAVLVYCKPQYAGPTAFKPGFHSLQVTGGPLGPLFRHHLNFALRSEQLKDLDILVTSRIGHVRIESDDTLRLPVLYRDRVLFDIKGPENAQAHLTHVWMQRTLLPGGGLLLAGVGACLLFLHWLAKKPLTREKLIRGMLLVGSSTLGLLLCAVGLQVFHGRVEDWRVFPPHLNYTYRILPDVTPGIPEGMVQFKTNSEGIRARERGADFDRNFSVLCLGGSTTEGLFLGEENHWPRVLERRLQEARGTNVWVGNAGRSGLSTAQLVLVASNYLPRIKPHAVVVLTGVNEQVVPENPEEARAGQVNWTLRETIKNRLRPIRLFRLIKDTLFEYRDLSPNDVDLKGWGDTSAYEGQRQSLQEHARRYPPRERTWENLDLSGFERSLRALWDACGQHGATLILCTQPSIYREDLKPEELRLLWMLGNYTPASKRRRLDRINDKTREVAKQLGLKVVDLDRELPRTTEVFYDDCHFNVEGARRVAELIFEQCFR
jgi:lysophospholipase L1-like esterase